MRNYTFDEVKMSHTGMLRAKERLISKAQAAASRQGLIGKAEFAVVVAALFLYEIWFSIIVYAHLFVRRVIPGKRMTKIAVIVLAVLVFSGIAAFASGSKNGRGDADENAAVEGGDADTEANVGAEEQADIDGSESAEVAAQAEAGAEDANSEGDVAETSAESEDTADNTGTDGEEAATVDVENADAGREDAAAADSEDVNVDSEDADSAADSEDASSEESSKHKSLAELKKENDDFYGWLSSPEAGIDCPVMYCSSCPEKYLSKNFYGKKSKNGAACVVDKVSNDVSSIILYAGNVNGKGDFAGLLKFKDADDAYGTVKFETMKETIEFEIVTGFTESSKEAKSNDKLLHIGDDAKEGDCFLVLVTGTEDGPRYYVVAKSIREED